MSQHIVFFSRFIWYAKRMIFQIYLSHCNLLDSGQDLRLIVSSLGWFDSHHKTSNFYRCIVTLLKKFMIANH
jgi:hypothetical protein